MSLYKFYANRRDGLGERLNAVFNAVVLSELTKTDLGFIWPHSYVFDDKFHSVESVEKIFSKKFIDKYLVDESELKDLTLVRLDNDFFESLDKLNALLENNEKILPQNIILNRLKYLSLSEKEVLLKSVLSKLEFSNELKEIYDYVNNLELPSNLCVIHLRAGDVIYGQYRMYPQFSTKYISATTAVALIESLLEKGEKILLVGQDIELINNLKNRFSLLTTESFIDHGFDNNLHMAFFEIFLMARSRKIYASSASGFPRFAVQLGMVNYADPRSTFTFKDEILYLNRELQMFSEMYSSEQKSASCFNLFWRNRNSDDLVALTNLLDLACLSDPTNEMNLFYKAILLIKSNNINEADEIFRILLNNCLGEEPEEVYFNVLMKRNLSRLLSTTTSNNTVNYIDFKECVLKETNSIYVLLLHFFLVDEKKDKENIAIKLNNSPNWHLRLYGKYFLNLIA